MYVLIISIGFISIVIFNGYTVAVILYMNVVGAKESGSIWKKVGEIGRSEM